MNQHIFVHNKSNSKSAINVWGFRDVGLGPEINQASKQAGLCEKIYLQSGLQKFACPLTMGKLMETSGKYILNLGLNVLEINEQAYFWSPGSKVQILSYMRLLHLNIFLLKMCVLYLFKSSRNLNVVGD
jgi:hypothetical protein